jgi:serine protease Do
VQIDASINGGNSGGAIVDKKGLVYGVVSSKISGAGIEGVAFGIPANQVLDRLKLAFQ